MKPFFKAVLLINHTDNKDLVDYNQLRLLAEEKNLVKNPTEFDEIIARFDDLCHALIKSNPPSADDFNTILNKFGFDDEKNLKELNQVWEHEKDTVFSYLIKKSGNFRKLDKIEWSLNHKFYTKKAKNLNEMSAIIALKTSNFDNSSSRNIAFELSSQELSQLKADLQQIDIEISGLASLA